MDAGSGSSPLAVTFVGVSNSFIISALPKSFTGLVDMDAVAVGVRFPDLGSGYWVVPVQNLDPDAPGQRDFSFGASFNPNIPAGPRSLDFVGIGKDGSAGTQYSLPVCFESRVPDNGHACSATKNAPPVVFALRWDTPFDLDLHVVLPNNQEVSAKYDPIVGDAGVANAMTSYIDRDSMGNCANDTWREEDLVFETPPAPGLYDVYADPYAACGQSAVHFNFTIYTAGDDGNLHPGYSQDGELLASQVTGGQSAGLFVYETTY
jgi:hypothetical protein